MPSLPAKRSWRILHSECSLGWGGQEHRVLAELRGFQERGSEVRLLAPEQSQVFQRARAAGLPTKHLDVSRLRFPVQVVRLAAWLRKERIEVLNPHSSRDAWLLGVAGRLARVPFIVRTRHIDVDYPNRWLSRHAFTALADHVITTSGKITKHFQEIFGLSANRISTLPTGIDLQRFHPAGPKAELAKNHPPGPLIGMISVLRSWKGHSTFLAAAQELVQSGFNGQFVIIGDGPIRSAIEAEIAALGLTQRVQLLGHREDVPEVLRALQALVIASTRHEGIPQIGLQALATETPVIGSDVGGTPEIIRPGETGRIFPSADSRALAQAIQETLTDEPATILLAKRGRTMVEQHHSLDHMLEKLEALYRRHLPL